MANRNTRALVNKRIQLAVIYVVLAACILVTIIPVVTMFATSFKEPGEVLGSLKFFPEHWSIQNYINVFQKTLFLKYIGNSIIVAAIVTVCSVLISVMAGYSLSRYAKRLKPLGLMVYVLLIIQMFPAMIIIIPLFVMINAMGLTDTFPGISLVYISFSLPLNIWMLQGFFDSIPIELEEAALIDGSSRFGTLIRIVMPVAATGVASTAIFAFNYCWNEFMFASIFIKSDAMRLMTVGLYSFKAYSQNDWGSIMAASMVAVLPVTIFLIFMQNYIVKGLTAGAVKA
jgi:ABC-type glycerol-3-phosphate transport system permease component